MPVQGVEDIMEFQLDRTQINGFDVLVDTTLRPEETLEMIVPDACPDIQRIVETDGRVLLRSKEAAEGRAEIAGTFKLSVLYLPDGETGIRHLDVMLPFTCAVDGRDIASGCTVVASARLCQADARAINPRKILVRAEAAVAVNVFVPRLENICSRIAEIEDGHMEQLIEQKEIYLTACIQEKPFALSEEINLSTSRPAAVELLKSRVSLNCGDSKIIGNKLIFKGSANIALLYRGEDDGIYTTSAELPISQIMEVADVGEEGECDLTMTLTGADCVLSQGGEGHIVSVSVESLAQAVIRECRTLEVLVDAYSTAEPVVAEMANCQMAGRVDKGIRNQNIREVWETTERIREIIDSRIAVGQITRGQERERQSFTAQAEVQILYVDEEGELFAARRSIEIPCELDLPEGCQCMCRCEWVGDLYATPTNGGIEVRFAIDFHYCIFNQQQIISLTDLLPGDAPEEAGGRPSLVLRMLEPGERLWDVAKTYGTTVADIINANELTEEIAANGKLLLIPGRR